MKNKNLSFRFGLALGCLLVFIQPFSNVCYSASFTDEDRFFESKVRPIISKNCLSCHKGALAKNGFRLESRSHFFSNPQTRINLILKTLRPSFSKTNLDYHTLALSEYQILKRWVEQGTHWPDYSKKEIKKSEDTISHWAFKPIKPKAPPEVSDIHWNNHPIDRFIYHRLATHGLSPSKKASPRTLIRRLYLTVIGLHPSSDELKYHLKNWDSTSFEKLAELLMGQPAYGEKWARHWLDVARYSDAKGYVDAGEVKYPFAYSFRDYVINAFNSDLSFDQFVREQIAADQFSTSQNSPSLAALGFLTVGHRFNFFYDEIIDDRIDVVTRGFLGLSASCARCHDHKFDPIPTTDYYSLFGVFRNSTEPTPNLLPTLNASDVKPFQNEANNRATNYNRFRENLHEEITTALSKWSGDYLSYIVQISPNHRTKPQPEYITDRGLVRIKSAYSSGGIIRWQKFLNSIDENHRIFGFWKSAWNLPKENFETNLSLKLESLKSSGWHNELVLETASNWPDGFKNMDIVSKIYGKVFETTFDKLEKLKEGDPRETMTGEKSMDEILTFFRSSSSPSLLSLDESEDVYLLDESSSNRRNFAEIERAFLEKWQDAPPRAMVMIDRPENEKITQVVYKRGDKHLEGRIVPNIIPAWVSGTEEIPIMKGSGRKELAIALTHPQNPLTPRVIVNRIWEWHFGQGLVKTPSDFGTQSQLPSHPDLLDFLADWFIKNNWSIKKLNKFILTSNTWQQSSRVRPHNQDLDPDNNLLWRRSVQRLDFEVMRDSILKMSQELDLQIGGIPITQSPDDILNKRRTIYSFVDRENLSDVFMVFDFPSPDISAPKRNETIVPQQTLFLLNNPFIIHHSRCIVDKILQKNPKTLEQVLSALHFQILLRRPNREESESLLEYFSDINKDKAALSKNEVQSRLVEIAQALIVSNEFQFME